VVAAIHIEAVAWNVESAIVVPGALGDVDEVFLRGQALRVTETHPALKQLAIAIHQGTPLAAVEEETAVQCLVAPTVVASKALVQFSWRIRHPLDLSSFGAYR